MDDKIFNLTTLTEFLNETYKSKKTGKPFTTTDTQQYIRRGYIPKYLGNINIVKLKDFPGRIYKLVKN